MILLIAFISSLIVALSSSSFRSILIMKYRATTTGKPTLETSGATDSRLSSKTLTS